MLLRTEEHRVCQKEVIDVDADGNLVPLSQKSYPLLMPGDKFVTTFGIVQVISDNRLAPTSNEAVSMGPSQRKGYIRRRNRIFMTAAKFQRRRREKFSRLFNENVIGDKLQEEVWKEYCPSTTPAAILSGAWSWKTNKLPTTVNLSPVDVENDNAKPDQDTSIISEASPDRIVECVLIKDERRRVTDIDEDLLDEGRWSKADVAKAAIDKAKKALLINNVEDSARTVGNLLLPNAIHGSGMKLFLQRRVLEERYSDTIPIYQCFRCGRVFSSRPGLKGHLHDSVCEKKAEQLVKDRRDRLELVETTFHMTDLKTAQKGKPKPGVTVTVSSSNGARKIKASLFRKLPGWIVFHHDRSSMYPEVCLSIAFPCLLAFENFPKLLIMFHKLNSTGLSRIGFQTR